MKILSLNCQKDYQPGLSDFLKKTLQAGTYDFLVLQEVDGKVVPMLNASDYLLLSVSNPEAGGDAHVRIAYRKQFALQNSFFQSFSNLNRRYFGRAELGFLAGIFNCNGKSVTIGSAHLHPSLVPRLRLAELKIVKKELLGFAAGTSATVLCGDFNFGLPWEPSRATRVMLPEFVDGTEHTGPTLNSRYSEVEPHTHFSATMAGILSRCGITVLLKTDRVFVDAHTARSSQISVRVLPDRVSDHSPVELILE